MQNGEDLIPVLQSEARRPFRDELCGGPSDHAFFFAPGLPEGVSPLESDGASTLAAFTCFGFFVSRR